MKNNEEKTDWGEPVEIGAPVAIDFPGCVVAGYYVGASEVTTKTESGQKRKSTIHSLSLHIETMLVGQEPAVLWEPGDVFRFWGSYDLDQKLKVVPVGHLIKITYLKKEKLSGDRAMKMFEVRLAKEPTQTYDELNPPPPDV